MVGDAGFPRRTLLNASSKDFRWSVEDVGNCQDTSPSSSSPGPIRARSSGLRLRFCLLEPPEKLVSGHDSPPNFDVRQRTKGLLLKFTPVECPRGCSVAFRTDLIRDS